MSRTAAGGWVVAAILAVITVGMCWELNQRPPKVVPPALGTHGAHAKPGPGQVMEVWIEDLLLWESLREKDPNLHEPGVVVSVRQQQSVLWISAAHEFKIIGLKPLRGAPKDPFFRQFSEQTEKVDEWSTQVASGPAKREASPGQGKVFSYKATIKLKSGRIIDPHIMTVE
jgi:hypothetical protein